MTNSSPQNPQSSEPSSYTPEEVQRIRRNVRQRASRDVSEEWIAAIVAFGTIGAILFWSLGGRKNNLNLLSQNSFFSSNQTTETDANSNLDLDSQDFLTTDDSGSFNLSSFSVDNQSDKTVASDSSSLDFSTTNNLNQNNNSSALLNRSRSVPSITDSLIPKSDSEIDVEAINPKSGEIVTESDTSELEVDADVNTEADVEVDVDATADIDDETGSDAISENEVDDTSNEATADADIDADTNTEATVDADVDSEADTSADSEADTDAIAFSKLSQEHWSYPFISKLAAENLLPNAQGFKPDDPINRAEMATLISSAFKDNSTIEAPKQFTDVSANSKVITDINKAVSLGFMNGYSEGDFRPQQNIPRYQVLVALATGLGLEPSGNPETILQNFGDGSELPEWAFNKVAAATESGLTINRPGFATNSLNPEQPATRAEVASMIYQALAKSGKVPNIESEYIVNPK